MLFSSRRCLSINKQSYKTPKQLPREPLLFLYPRWFHNTVATYQPSLETSSTIPRRAWVDLGHLSTSDSSGANIIPPKLPRRAWTDLREVASTDSLGADATRIETVPISHEDRDILQGSQLNCDSTRDQWRPSLHSRNNAVSSSQKRDSSATTLSSSPTSTDLDSISRNFEVRHYEPKLRIRRSPQSVCRQVLARGPKFTAKTIKKGATKKLHDPASIEWSEPIRLLAQLIHRPKEVLGERLELHWDTVYRLTGTVGTNAWFHQVRLGCEVRVLGDHGRHQNKLVVILHGMPRARQLTREYLLQVDRDVAKSTRWNISSDDGSVLIRFVLSSLAWHYRTKDCRRADAVEQPRVWTVRSFADIVETLTTMQIPSQLRRELYDGGDSHNRTVAKVLENLFSDPRSEPFISLRALNCALRFTCKHTEINATSNFLFEKAKSIGLSLQADTFNILIEESLRQNRLESYRALLASMQRIGVVPNGMTWVALLKATKSRGGRRAILQHLRQKWSKDSGLWQQVALELVTTDFARLVRLEKSFDYFVDFMDQSFPSPWLSARCINRMLHVCAEKKLWELVPRILVLGESRGGVFNAATQTLLLSVFQKRGSIRDSLDLLESHFAKTIGNDSAFTIPVVFLTAWNKRFYNVCRVLWRFAAVSGDITSTMLNAVASSLIKNSDESSSSRSHLWRITAGKVIAGMDFDISGIAVQFPQLNQKGLTDPMRVLTQWAPADGTRQEQLSLAYTIIHRDITAYKRFSRFSFQQLFGLLRKAYERDCEWMHQGKVRKYSDLPWMIENAIDVPLRPLADQTVSPRHLLWPINENGDYKEEHYWTSEDRSNGPDDGGASVESLAEKPETRRSRPGTSFGLA